MTYDEKDQIHNLHCPFQKGIIYYYRDNTIFEHNIHSSGKHEVNSYTVPFQLIRPSRVTGPVVLAEFGHLSRVTTPLADNFWWIQKMVKKGLKKMFTGVGHMQHFFYLHQ